MLNVNLTTPLPGQVDLLNVEDVQLRLSFKTDVSARPRSSSTVRGEGVEGGAGEVAG